MNYYLKGLAKRAEVKQRFTFILGDQRNNGMSLTSLSENGYYIYVQFIQSL